MVLTSIKANPSIPIKTLIAKIKNLHGYTIIYRKAWLGKQKVLVMAFVDWEQNDLPRWLEAVKESNMGTIVQYIASPCMVDGVHDKSCYTLDHVFWSFKPCIDEFNFCKPIVQVDGTFLTRRYHATLLTAIAQDGNQNTFPLVFGIVEGETREALIWFFQLLCMITDRGIEIGWEGDDLVSVYCISHIASNFNKKLKNAEL
uniref:Putative mutator sub-class protein n=1 Tax=Phaseolus vulgaris TaxID=3885 RepID=I7B2E9_PHAVU|nr:putative mutator sub-class protein [Phaseolus vulgaris]